MRSRKSVFWLIFFWLIGQLLLNPAFASKSGNNVKASKNKHLQWEEVLELQGTESTITKTYRFNKNKLRLKFQVKGFPQSSSVAIRVVPVKPANKKETVLYRTGNASQTVDLKYQSFYLIISSLESTWKIKVEKVVR